jgi:multiple sugar transport system permease protein
MAVAAGGRHRPPAWRRALPENLTGWGFVLPASIIVLGLGFFPVIWSFLLSTKAASGFGPERSVGLANYRELAHDPEWLDAVSRSLKFTLLYVPTTVLLGLGLALLLNQKIRFIGFYRTCFFVPFVASAAATGVIFLYVLDPQYGIVDNGLAWMGLPRQQFLDDPDWALFLLAPIYTWTAVGFDVLIYLAALQDVPHDQTEAARIDGAGRFGVFRHVILPALRPITVLAVVWETINALQFFDLAWTTKRGGPIDATTVIIVYGYKLGFVQGRPGLGAAVACVLFLAIVVLVLLQVLYARRRRLDVF